MAVIFPDIEVELVTYLDLSLATIDNPVAANVRVATKKTPPDLTQPLREVIVTGSYGFTLDPVRRQATAVLEIYAEDYAAASELALLVAALIVQVPGDHIKRAVVNLGPVRLPEENEQEKRSIEVDLIVKGTNL